LNIRFLFATIQTGFEKSKRKNLDQGLDNKEKINCQIYKAEYNLLQTEFLVERALQNIDHNRDNNAQLHHKKEELMDCAVVPLIPQYVYVPLFVQVKLTFLLLTWIDVEILVFLLLQDLVYQQGLFFKFGEIKIFIFLQLRYLVDSLTIV